MKTHTVKSTIEGIPTGIPSIVFKNNDRLHQYHPRSLFLLSFLCKAYITPSIKNCNV